MARWRRVFAGAVAVAVMVVTVAVIAVAVVAVAIPRRGRRKCASCARSVGMRAERRSVDILCWKTAAVDDGSEGGFSKRMNCRGVCEIAGEKSAP